jgi:hypothetical protein
MGRIMGAVLSTEYALAAAVTVTFVDRLGRRSTMLTGALGCGLAFVAATVLVYFSDRDNSRGAAWGAVGMYFVYNTCELPLDLLGAGNQNIDPPFFPFIQLLRTGG